MSLILTDLLKLDKIDKFVATCWQAGNIDNLQQVCGVFGSAAKKVSLFQVNWRGTCNCLSEAKQIEREVWWSVLKIFCMGIRQEILHHFDF